MTRAQKILEAITLASPYAATHVRAGLKTIEQTPFYSAAKDVSDAVKHYISPRTTPWVSSQPTKIFSSPHQDVIDTIKGAVHHLKTQWGHLHGGGE